MAMQVAQSSGKRKIQQIEDDHISNDQSTGKSSHPPFTNPPIVTAGSSIPIVKESQGTSEP